MDSIVKLLNKQPVTAISTNDIFTFISLYPEWLSRMSTSWPAIVRVRNHIFQGEDLDNSIRQQMIEFFLCDLIQISLTLIHVFDEFIIIENSQPILTAYHGEEINVDHYKGVSLPLPKLLKDRELSGVSFLLNMLREVIA